MTHYTGMQVVAFCPNELTLRSLSLVLRAFSRLPPSKLASWCCCTLDWRQALMAQPGNWVACIPHC